MNSGKSAKRLKAQAVDQVEFTVSWIKYENGPSQAEGFKRRRLNGTLKVTMVFDHPALTI